MGLGCPVCDLLSGYPGGKSSCDREDCPEIGAVPATMDRIRILEDALRPFAELAEAVEKNLPAKDDRWALVRVRDRGITYADLKRAKNALR